MARIVRFDGHWRSTASAIRPPARIRGMDTLIASIVAVVLSPRSDRMEQNPYESPREPTQDGPVMLSEAAVAFYSIAVGVLVFAVSSVVLWIVFISR